MAACFRSASINSSFGVTWRQSPPDLDEPPARQLWRAVNCHLCPEFGRQCSAHLYDPGAHQGYFLHFLHVVTACTDKPKTLMCSPEAQHLRSPHCIQATSSKAVKLFGKPSLVHAFLLQCCSKKAVLHVVLHQVSSSNMFEVNLSPAGGAAVSAVYIAKTARCIAVMPMSWQRH